MTEPTDREITVTNLNKLADYIEKNVKQGQLDMRDYRQNDDGYTAFYSTDDCGTSGCALGWAPFVVAPVDSDYDGEKELDFDSYSFRVFPCLHRKTKHLTNLHWTDVFFGGLSSKKPEVIQRLRDKAKELAA